MKGTFRSDADLVEAPRGGLRLKRRAFHRVLSVALVLLAGALAAVDFSAGRRLLGALTAILGVGFLVLLLRAEVDAFVFDGKKLLRRWLTIKGVSEARLEARSVARVGVQHEGKRARAWIETKSGEQYALIEGEAEAVDRAVEQLVQAISFAAADPRGAELH